MGAAAVLTPSKIRSEVMVICQWILLLLLVSRTGIGCAKEKTLKGRFSELLAHLILATFIWACGSLSTIFGTPWNLF